MTGDGSTFFIDAEGRRPAELTYVLSGAERMTIHHTGVREWPRLRAPSAGVAVSRYSGAAQLDSLSTAFSATPVGRLRRVNAEASAIVRTGKRRMATQKRIGLSAFCP